MTAVILWVIVLVLVVAILVRSVRVVEQASALIIQRLGRYHATLGPGLHLIVPFVDGVRAHLDLREQPIEFQKVPVITQDNVTVEVDTVAYIQVVDPKRAVYEISDYHVAIDRLIQTTLRNVAGELTLDQMLTSREQVNAKLRIHLDEAADKWGVKVNRVELRAIEPPREIQAAMELQMKAERERRAKVTSAEATKQAAILEAEGQKRAIVLQAEAVKEKQVLEAEGEAEAILRVRRAQAEGLRLLREAAADQPVLALQAFDALREVANGQATKIFIPSDLVNLIGLAGALGEVLRAPEPPLGGARAPSEGRRPEPEGSGSQPPMPG
ncbi:MAG: SPFH/Band 7/PHB domain protein [Clostridia bacterium]|nr:SPFH/Band 7/PHB domain protein [Clostridia bacterium]